MSGTLTSGVLVDGANAYGPFVNLMGGGASLVPNYSLNFLTGTLDPSLTFTRASTATYYNSSGILTQAATNAPRFDYDPSTLQLKGLLLEQQSTNNMVFSQQYTNAAWANTAGNVIDNYTTSPDGGNNASVIFQTNGSSSDQVLKQAAGATSSTTNTISIYVKKLNYDFVRIVGANFGTTQYATATFQFSNVTYVAGAVAGGWAITSSSYQLLPNGWYRLVLVINTPTPSTCGLWVGPSNSQSLPIVGTATNGLYVYGAQCEPLPYATSYIPTTSAAVTRAVEADNNTSISAFYNQANGTRTILGKRGENPRVRRKRQVRWQ